MNAVLFFFFVPALGVHYLYVHKYTHLYIGRLMDSLAENITF